MDRAARRAKTDPLGGGGDGGSCNPSVLVVEVAMIMYNTGSRRSVGGNLARTRTIKCGRTTDRLLEIQSSSKGSVDKYIMLILSIVFSRDVLMRLLYQHFDLIFKQME